MVQRMMEFDRSRQSLLIDGMCYTSEDVERLTDGEMETFPSAVREVLLFLKRWFYRCTQTTDCPKRPYDAKCSLDLRSTWLVFR